MWFVALIVIFLHAVTVHATTGAEFTIPTSIITNINTITKFQMYSVFYSGITPQYTLLLGDTTNAPDLTNSTDPNSKRFSSELLIVFTLGTSLSFDLKLFKDTLIVTPDTKSVFNGVTSTIIDDNDFKVYTYSAHYLSQDNNIPSYATFTIVSNTDLSVQTNTLRGMVNHNGIIYQIDNIYTHEFILNNDKQLTQSLLQDSQYIVQNYETDSDDVAYNHTEHVASVNTLNQLEKDLVQLQQESTRLQMVNDVTSYSLMGYRHDDVYTPNAGNDGHVCSEIEMDVPLKTSASVSSHPSPITPDIHVEIDSDDDIHAHNHNHDYVISDFRQQRAFLRFPNPQSTTAPAAEISINRTTIGTLMITNRHEGGQARAVPLSYNPSNTVVFEKSSKSSPEEDEIIDLLSEHTDALLHDPLSLTPKLSRWMQCHKRANQLTGLKLNLLVSFGASQVLTGRGSPTYEAVLSAVQSLLSQSNNILMTQIGMYLTLSTVIIQTTSGLDTYQWNYGYPSASSSVPHNCPTDPSTISPMLKALRSETDQNISHLPPAAITHLILGCYSTGLLGQAYVGAVRTLQYSVGWSSQRSVSSGYITFTHEISHNLGGRHPWTTTTQQGTFGGLMDYGAQEGVLTTLPFKGEIGYNIDTDYANVCGVLGADKFWQEPAQRGNDVFSLADTLVMTQFSWFCSPKEISNVNNNALLYIDNTVTTTLPGSTDTTTSSLGYTPIPANSAPAGSTITMNGKVYQVISPCDNIDTYTCSVVCSNRLGTATRYKYCIDSSNPVNPTIVSDEKCVALLSPSLTPAVSKPCVGPKACSDDGKPLDGSSSNEDDTETAQPPETPEPAVLHYVWVCATTTAALPAALNAIKCSLSTLDIQNGVSTNNTIRDSQSWGICDANCGTGEKTRIAKCVSISENKYVGDSFCTGRSLPKPSTSQSCSNMNNCMLSWICGASDITMATATSQNTGDCNSYTYFTSTEAIPLSSPTTPALLTAACPNQCGSYSYKRSVLCKQSDNFVDPSLCLASNTLGTKPVDIYTCSSYTQCSYEWKCATLGATQTNDYKGCDVASFQSSSWTECLQEIPTGIISSSIQPNIPKCQGVRVRNVICMRMSDSIIVADSLCGASPPAPVEQCTLSACTPSTDQSTDNGNNNTTTEPPPKTNGGGKSSALSVETNLYIDYVTILATITLTIFSVYLRA